MCDCGKNCEIPVGPIGPQGIEGEQGEQGIEGPRGPQGEQGIPGQDGLDGDQIPLVWVDFVLENDWQPGAIQTPQYAIQNGLLYTRGQLVLGPATASGIWATLDPGGLGSGLSTTIASTDSPTTLSRLDWGNFTKQFNIVDWSASATDRWSLDSVPALSIR